MQPGSLHPETVRCGSANDGDAPTVRLVLLPATRAYLIKNVLGSEAIGFSPSLVVKLRAMCLAGVSVFPATDATGAKYQATSSCNYGVFVAGSGPLAPHFAVV